MEEQEFLRELETARGPLRAYAFKLTGVKDAAHELLQDTILRTWRARDQFKPGTSFRAWVLRIMRNRFIDLKRRAQLVHFVSLDNREGAVAKKIADATARADARTELEEALNVLSSLSPEHQEILRLAGIEHLSYEEIATKLKCPLGTVRSRLARAREELAGRTGRERTRTRFNGRKRTAT